MAFGLKGFGDFMGRQWHFGFLCVGNGFFIFMMFSHLRFGKGLVEQRFKGFRVVVLMVLGLGGLMVVGYAVMACGNGRQEL